MVVFDTNYFNETDPFERAVIAAETALDIAVSQALKDYAYESGLVELSDNSVFTEAGKKDNNTPAKSGGGNIFVRAAKSIFNAIGNFISDIIAAITGNASKRAGDGSGDGELDKNISKLDKAIDDEVSMGKRLFKQASSASGLSDSEIEDWTDKAVKRVKSVATIALPVLSAVGINKLISFLKNKKSDVKQFEEVTVDGEKNSATEAQGGHKIKIVRGIQKIIQGALSGITTSRDVRRSDKHQGDEEYVAGRKTQAKKYEDLEVDYKTGRIDKEEYYRRLQELGATDKEVQRGYAVRQDERRAQEKRDKEVRNKYAEAKKKIADDHKNGKITKEKRNSLEILINDIFNDYITNANRGATEHKRTISEFENKVLNRN